MVGAVGGEHLVPAGDQPGHAHRVLVGVGPAVGEEDLVQVARRPLGDQPRGLAARVVGLLRRDGAQLRGLRLDGRDDPRVRWWPTLVFTSWLEKSR